MTGNDEWYTPRKYVDSARKTMGSIDLDPASCEAANAAVRAVEFYTEEQDGLALPWYGNVWLNPPYSKGLYAPFCEAVCANYYQGLIKQAVVLTNNNTEVSGTQILLSQATAICLPDHRIKFVAPDGKAGASPTKGQIFYYFGPRVERFRFEFKKYGAVIVNAENV